MKPLSSPREPNAETEARLNAALSVARLGTFEWNVRTNAVLLDQRSCEIFGFSADDGMVAQRIYDRVHPDDLPRVQAAVRASLSNLSRLEIEYRVCLPTGEERFIASVNHVTAGEDGQAERAFGVFSDITDRRRAEQALRDTEARLAAIFESLPVGVGVVDTTGRLLLSNPEMQRFWPTGMLPSQDESLIHRWRGFHPDGRRIEPRDFPGARALRGERVLPGVEMLYRQESGDEIWTRITAVPIRDSEGQIAGQVAVVTDIDALKRTSEALRASESRQAYLLKLSDAIRLIRDPEEVKTAACSVLGEHLRTNRAFYAEVDGNDWVVHGRYEKNVSTLPTGRYAAQTYGPRIMETYRAGKPVIFRDTRQDSGFSPEERAAHDALAIIGAVGIPLIKEGKLVAILAVHTADPRDWTNEEIEIVQETAERTWAAVERARAETAVRTSEGRYRLLLNSIDEGFSIIEMLLDSNGRPHDYRFVEYNPMFEKQTGLYNAIGRTVRELVPDLEPFWFETYGRVALTGEASRFVSSSEPLGRTFDVYAFRVGEPEELRVALFFRDITAQERSKAALVESESRFRHLADHAPVMVWVTEPDGSCSYLSRSWYEFTGQNEDTGLGFGWLEATHPDDRAAAEQAFLDANATHSAFRIEYRLRRHDGAYRWAIDAAAPRLGPNREFLGYVGSVLDITDRKSAEEALRDSETRFRVLTESVPQLVWTCLPDGRCDYLSSQWVAYTGIAENEQLDLRWLEKVIHPDDRIRTREHWLGAVAGHHGYDIEYRIRAADGSYRWFQTRGVPLRDEHGTILKWFGTCTDIDDLKRAEEGLRKANRELEEFAYVASHDLQEPLRMVNIFTEKIIRLVDREDDKFKQYAGYVEQGVKRMQTLIHDLLEFSRTVQEREQPAGIADLSASLRDTLSVLENRIVTSGATIMAQPLPQVQGDTKQLSHVFQNLISNSLKYADPHRQPVISISVATQPGHHVISVRDNGIGFEQKYAERIFGLFKRLHTGKYPGTGLGLAICQRIVERHGGRIWAEGQPGEGATFFVSLPQADTSELDPSGSAATRESRTSGEPEA